ncbi:hypothetical protein DPV78_009584 [Talaromyces pinophilus]|nr:hypothetical protein DPV78_009584 [Talaromyces pinophilus]
MTYTWFPLPSSPSNTLTTTNGSSLLFTFPANTTSFAGAGSSGPGGVGLKTSAFTPSSNRGRWAFNAFSEQFESLSTIRTVTVSSKE